MPSQGEQAARKVELQTTTSLKINPSKIRVEPGESIELVITDTSRFPHTFTIATPGAKRKILQDVTIVGNETKSVSVTFTEETGTLYLFCRPHEWAGMIGTIGVGAEPTDPNGPGTDYRTWRSIDTGTWSRGLSSQGRLAPVRTASPEA